VLSDVKKSRVLSGGIALHYFREALKFNGVAYTVNVALVVLDHATAVDIAVTEPVLPLSLPPAIFPKPDVDMAIRPPLHPVTASESALKVASVQTAVLEKLHTVSVVSVSCLHLPVRQWAAM
jgi:hypothetical protein